MTALNFEEVAKQPFGTYCSSQNENQDDPSGSKIGRATVSILRQLQGGRYSHAKSKGHLKCSEIFVVLYNTKRKLNTKSASNLHSKSDDDNHQDLINTPLSLPAEEASRKGYIVLLQDELHQAKIDIETQINAVQTALDNYNIAADRVDSNTPLLEQIQTRVEANTEKAIDLIDRATVHQTKLLKLLDKLERTT
ncbi:hypothetical protein KIN20_018602 [Parelaphostrongylus tenuis]|uniref:Uncharacterized protein n=1 Tax=Parelaphostrongylus tenuis TaxID=148309 RepID=A0AAD5QUG1_PARTN|nr:hypothetical protein KIN20_018602 [Parelaphostrongylus tenuis]